MSGPERQRAGVRGVIFAGGGTGGHIFPGLAIAERLRERSDLPDRRRGAEPAVRCVFAVSRRALDAQILGTAGEEMAIIPAEPLGIRPRALIRFISSWGKAVRASRALIRRVRDECPGGLDVLAMGGFVAGPFVQAARVEGAAVTLVNLDAVPGRANRWIAGRAGRVLSAVPLEAGVLPARGGITVVPPIVRRAALAPGPAAECRRMLGLDPDRPTLMVTGASQGARSVNEFATAFVGEHRAELLRDRWQVVHQTGKGEAEGARAAYGAAGVPAVVEAFFDRMGLLWGSADLAVSRSGAGSVAEAWANTVPTVFMPYPYHKDQHQKHNAQGLMAAGASIVCDDLIDAGRNVEAIGPALLELVRDAAARGRMRAAYAKLGPADGAERIAAQLLA